MKEVMVIIKNNSGFFCNTDNLNNTPVKALLNHSGDIVFIMPEELVEAGITGDIAEREPEFNDHGWTFLISSVEIIKSE